MKKICPLILLVAFLVGCSSVQPTKVDTNLLYTEAAKTVFVQMTQMSVLTPSATMTFTPVPTATITLTPVPSPTPVPPTPTWVALQPGKVTAPVFLFYRVAGSAQDDPNYQWDSASYIPPDKFTTEMQMLQTAGYSSFTISQLSEAVTKGGTVPPHPFVVTFDSAAISDYTIAYPILKKFGFIATVYADPAQIGGGGMMSLDQIKELITAGWEFGSKVNSQTDLEKKIGVDVKSFSYPGGFPSGGIDGARVSKWGYTSAVCVGRSNDITSDNLFCIPRYEMRRDLVYAQFAALLPFAPQWIPTEIPTATKVPTAPK